MVKNVKGGSGHKSLARKGLGDNNKASNKLRISEDECEIYAQVTKLLGNGMCHVNCMDGQTRLCIIRGKFRGRGKRENKIDAGSWVLVGKRDWESEKKNEIGKCDLLEVYNDMDVERLKKSVNENWRIFNYTSSYGTDTGKIDSSNSNNEIDFTSEINDGEYEKLLKLHENENRPIHISLNEDEDDEINVDDL
jgi:translation initiation factor IF-1